MTCRRRGFRVLLLVAGLVVFLASPATGQVLHLGTWEGALEGVGEFRRNDVENPGQKSRSDDLRTKERLTIRNNGASLYDPRFITFSLGADIGLVQDQLTVNGENDSRNATLLGYDAFVNVLAEEPFSLTALANHNESSETRELSGLTETVTDNRAVTLSAKRLYIPSRVTFRQELQDEKTRVADVVARRQEERRIARYHGQRGWLDSDLDVLYEFVDDTDKVSPDLSYQSHEAQMNYGIDFGEELNRHWDSRLRYFTRSGIAQSTLATADEGLRVDHTDRLRSDYRYLLVRTENPAGVNTTHTALANLRYRLYESLTTLGGLDAVRQTLPHGEKDSYRGRADVTYRKRLPLDGRLTAGVAGSMQYEDDRFETTKTSVIQESHTAASPFALPIPLNNTFVVASSIVVTKITFGPLPPGCVLPPGPPTPLVLGQDFTLNTFNDVTDIVPIPCAGVTAGINPGDTIAIDYVFTVSPSLTFTTSAWSANLSVDYRWIRVFYNHDQTNQSLIAGQDGRFLDNRRSDAVGGELRYEGARAGASVLGEARRFRSTRVNYDSLRVSTSGDVAPFASLILRLTGERIVTQFREQDRETLNESARASLTYTPAPFLFVEANATARRFEDTLQPTEQQTEAHLLVRWHIRKLEIIPSFDYLDRTRGDTRTTEYRAMLRTIRRF